MNCVFYAASQSLGFLLGYTKFVCLLCCFYVWGSGFLKNAWGGLIISGSSVYANIHIHIFVYIYITNK